MHTRTLCRVVVSDGAGLVAFVWERWRTKDVTPSPPTVVDMAVDDLDDGPLSCHTGHTAQTRFAALTLLLISRNSCGHRNKRLPEGYNLQRRGLLQDCLVKMLDYPSDLDDLKFVQSLRSVHDGCMQSVLV